MKKSLALAFILAVTISSCRKESYPYIYYNETSKMAYNSYAGQFDLIWKNISTGYVFWDIDGTDWDRVYEEYLPQFEELDRQVAQGRSVQDTILLKIYTSAMGNMIDHHMKVAVKNLHPAEGNKGSITIRPGNIEAGERPEYIESRADAQNHLKEFLQNVEGEYVNDGGVKVIEHRQITYDLEPDGPNTFTGLTYDYILFQLPDGRVVPYLWQNSSAIKPAITHLGDNDDEGIGAAILDHYFSMIATAPKDNLAGFILDNRANGGGYQDDLDYLIGSYINEEEVIYQTRYKEGPGRLEYSVWTDYKQAPLSEYHRDIVADDIPFVILTDILSTSMGEIEPICARNVLPTTYIIGETTFGATGNLQPGLTNLNYGGSFGSSDLSMGHYVYTSDFEARFNGQILEGKGIAPDQEVIRKANGGSFKPAIDAALQYIAEY